MGMAASQARLLMITSRLHDVELKAQQIQNAKLQLSTQQDAVYEEYQRALDATTLTMASIDTNGVRSDIVGTFDSIFGINGARPASIGNNSGYILVDSRGRVVVSDEIYEGYQEYSEWDDGTGLMNNAYQFALWMVEGKRNGHEIFDATGDISALGQAIKDVYNENKTEIDGLAEEAFAALDELSPGWDNGGNNRDVLQFLTFSIGCNYWNSMTDEQSEAINSFVNAFWSHYGDKVFNKLDTYANAENLDGDEYNREDFNYYVRIYNAIQQHGGCIAISDFDGNFGSASNNSEWLTAMLESGQLSIEQISIDAHGVATMNGVSVASDTNLNYTATTQIDKVALAKAEAKYEHDLKVIDRKDQKFDLELKKLETERTALTKEYDSIKKVSDDNIERTFGIFS